MALVVLDAGMANVALPTISTSLNIAPATSILVASGYQLALLIGLLPAAHVAERFGARRMFIGGVVTFTFASTLAAFAPSFTFLVAARFIQGLGGASILALGVALLRFALATERFGSAIAWNAMNVALSAAAGPAVGVLILAAADWRWLFLVNLPIGLLTLAASPALPKVECRGTSVDLVSILLHAAGAALLFLALGVITAQPALACLLAVASMLGFILLVRRERSRSTPLIPLDLLGHRPFRVAIGASICCFVAQCAGQLALPFYLQLQLSRGSLVTGMVMACWPLAVALTSPWASRLSERFGSSVLCAGGAAVLAIGLAAASLVPVRTSVAPLALCAVACGIGFGFFQIPNNRNLFLGAPPDRSAAAGGMQGTARLTGQILGAILVTLLFASFPGMAVPRLAMAVAATSALAAALISMRLATSGSRPALQCRI